MSKPLADAVPVVQFPRINIHVPDNYPRSEIGDVADLAASIATHGLLLFPVVDCTGELIDGRRRLEAIAHLVREQPARAAEWERVPCHVAQSASDAASILLMQRDLDGTHKPLARAEQLALAARLKPLLAADAAERQRASQLDGKATGGAPRRKGPVGGAKFASPQPRGKARDQAAAMVGLSGESLRQAEHVQAAARENPALFGCIARAMERGDMGIKAAYDKMQAWRKINETSRQRISRAAGEGEAAEPGRVEDPSPSPAAISEAHAELELEHRIGLVEGFARSLLAALRHVAELRPAPEHYDRLAAILEPIGDLFTEIATNQEVT